MSQKKINLIKFYKIIEKYVPNYKIPKLIFNCKANRIKRDSKAPNKKILRAELRNYIVKNKVLLKEF